MDIVERPGMPVGYGISAEAVGHVSWEWVAEQLSAARSYWVCTTREDGRPHAMPVWAVWQADRLLFSTDPTSLKARNFAARPDVVVHLESGDDVVVVEGRVAPMDVELIAAFCEACEVKYSNRPDPDNEAHGLYQLDPDRVLAWRETDFTMSATRFRRTLSS